MIASSYAHNIWRYEQPFPQSALDRGDSGISEYLDLMNASLVIAHEPSWIERFRSQPERYTSIWRGETFHLFQRKGYSPNYALSGEIANFSFDTNSITLTPLTDRVTLKFKYYPFLSTSACQIKPFKTELGLDLIELSDCKAGQPITIKSVSPLTRLLMSDS
jgi:hypothetical protein